MYGLLLLHIPCLNTYLNNTENWQTETHSTYAFQIIISRKQTITEISGLFYAIIIHQLIHSWFLSYTLGMCY